MHVSRPLIALLLGTVVFFAVWTLALKPGSSGSGNGSTSTNPYQSAIDKAHQAVANSNKVNARDGGTVTTTPATTATRTASTAQTTTAASTTHAATAQATHPSSATPKPAAKAPTTPAQREALVIRALNQHKVVAILFYNPAATDDQAVKAELATVPTHGGRVVKVAARLSELQQFPVVVNQVPITGSPTLVLIDGAHKATTIIGFSDRFEIERRVAVAL
jgi:hypothetical protein